MDKKLNRKQEEVFMFWQRWLYYPTYLFIFYGIGLTVLGQTKLASFYKVKLAEIFWQTKQMPEPAEAFYSFTIGPLGGTIAFGYVLFAYISAIPFKRKETWAYKAIALAFLFWLILDSAMAIYYGFYFHLIFLNGLSILHKVPPLIFTWKHFKKTGM